MGGGNCDVLGNWFGSSLRSDFFTFNRISPPSHSLSLFLLLSLCDLSSLSAPLSVISPLFLLLSLCDLSLSASAEFGGPLSIRQVVGP